MKKKNVLIDFIALPEALMQIDEEIKAYYKNVDLGLIGEILHWHLRVESAVHNLLNEVYAHTWKPAELERLRFNQKLALLPRKGTRPYPLPDEFHYENLLKACLELNTIRNKLAHNLHYAPTEKDIPEITRAIQAILGETFVQKTPGVSDRILQFSKMAERSLMIATEEFERKLEVARKKWMNDFKMRSQPRKRRTR